MVESENTPGTVFYILFLRERRTQNEKMEEIRAHNGSTIKVNISNKACEKYSGFKHGDFIVKDKKIAMAIGVGYNPFSLQTEFWKMVSPE